ncbi:aminotransferase class V-fold PLP-dependent enzyme [Leptolyngbya sp. FACHB-261]|uniref:aminotransferase class V-fold PLP-dependent enzyme n=1 Tax=Leptolyngbya sp. FACHB-261 TaxID=2692806 RepID=UPI0024117D78|nr:aminotransferase class V-fold PLP-dependent enzyme [Leptolyngbya sp. FACHB-261]
MRLSQRTGAAPLCERVALDLRQQMVQAFELISAHEEALGERLLSYLRTRPKVRVIGQDRAERRRRVPTIAFVVDGLPSEAVPSYIDAHKIGIRYGDFYARRLIEDLDLQAKGGVVRVSMVHYNSLEEVDRLIHYLDQVL